MFATAFDNWQDSPPPAIHTSCSPNLLLILAELDRRWPVFENLGCFGRRAIRGGTAPSSHWHGAAIDVGYPGSFDAKIPSDVAPWLIARSDELHLQALHDYRRRRIWRAGRTESQEDACSAWWRLQKSSTITGMGQVWCNHLHLETTADGWSDSTPVALRWDGD